MSETETAGGAGQQSAGSAGEQSSQQGAEHGDQSGTTSVQGAGPKSEAELRAELTKLQADLQNFKRIEDERKGKERKRQEMLLAEQGKFKELYETAVKEVEALKTKVDRADVVFKTMLDEELKELPEDFDKELIPKGDVLDQVAWLRKAKSVLIKKAEPKKGDGTPPMSGHATVNDMRAIYTNPTSPKR